MDWQQRWIAAICAAYPPPQPEPIRALLNTFEAESDANHAERERVWYEVLSPEMREALIELNRRENPELFP